MINKIVKYIGSLPRYEYFYPPNKLVLTLFMVRCTWYVIKFVSNLIRDQVFQSLDTWSSLSVTWYVIKFVSHLMHDQVCQSLDTWSSLSVTWYMIKFVSHLIRDQVCQSLVTGWWFSLGTLVSSTNKTDRHDITEILLKVLNPNPSK